MGIAKAGEYNDGADSELFSWVEGCGRSEVSNPFSFIIRGVNIDAFEVGSSS